MDYKAYLEGQVLIGYSKSDLERLIGLPKNFLSGFLRGKKSLGSKNKLRIENWDKLENKPTPLEVDFYLKKVANDNLSKLVFVSPTPISFDAAKIDKVKYDELGQWQEPKKDVAIKDLTKPTNQVKPIEQPKSNFTVDTKKHPLYKEGDPKEGSLAFFGKYSCETYDELSLKK